MGFSLSRLFGKNKTESELPSEFLVNEPASLSFKNSEERFFRYLFPKDTAQALTVPQKLVINVIKKGVTNRPFRDKAVPRLPTVIPKLLHSLRDPSSSAKDYVNIINKDPVMSAAVLKMANSTYFNPTGKRFSEIDRAVVKLGIRGLRSVLSAAVMQPIIQKDSVYFSESGKRIWQHSLSTAIACESIAKHRKMETFKVYILGLVHDIGKMTIFSELSKQYAKNGEQVSPGYNAFVPLMKVLAPVVSYWIAKDWELPEDICNALAEQANLKDGNKVSPLAYILYQANMAAEVYITTYPSQPELADQVLQELGLSKSLFENLAQASTDVE